MWIADTGEMFEAASMEFERGRFVVFKCRLGGGQLRIAGLFEGFGQEAG